MCDGCRQQLCNGMDAKRRYDGWMEARDVRKHGGKRVLRKAGIDKCGRVAIHRDSG